MADVMTPAQLRALHAGFGRLGYTRPSDRDDRLAVAAQLLGLDEPLGSFRELRFGQAGYLLGWLRKHETAGDGPGPDHPADGACSSPAAAGHQQPVTGADVLALAVVMMAVIACSTGVLPGLTKGLLGGAAAPQLPASRPAPAG